MGDFQKVTPYPYDKCTTVEKEINSNITKSCHLIGWNVSKYEYSYLCDVVKALTIPDVKYYAKGLKKVSDTIKLV